MSDRFDALARDMLPDNASAYMRASLASMLAALEIDVDAIERESRWNTASVDKLPFLAFDKGVRIWNDAWSEDRKRWVVRYGVTLARLQGTPLGIEIYLNLADGHVLREYLPPGGGFFLPDNKFDREAMAALMPQVRLYHSWPAKFMPRFMFFGAGYFGRHAITNDKAKWQGRYPVLWDRGVETPLGEGDFEVRGGVGTLLRPLERARGTYFGGNFFGRTYFGMPARKRSYKVELYNASELRVDNTKPIQRQLLTAGRNYFGAAYFGRDPGARYRYDRVVLWDASRLSAHAVRRNRGFYLGETRFAVKKYHIDLDVFLPGYPRRIQQRWRYFGAGYLINYKHDNLRFAMQALRAAKRGGDRILVNLVEGRGSRPATLPNLDLETAQ